MVDTGATHNVLAEKEAKKLGLKLSPSVGKIKAINSEARDIVGVAKGVLLQYHDVLFPEGSHPCFVRDQGAQKSQNTALLSAMQIKDGLRKGEETFLVTIRGPTPRKKGERQGCAPARLAALSWGDDNDNNPGVATGGLPGPIADVLREFAGVMPAQLPSKLPPRRDVDHEIKLLPGTRPTAQAPYKMPPAYLEELRKQLQELLESKLIRPSKAPFGARVLLHKKKDGSLRLCVDYRALNKSVVSSEPVLRLPKFNKPYEVHTDASNFALGGVLMQDGHLVDYESRKLNDAERRYSVHEKEMIVVVHCLRVWRHYLLGGKFVVYTDNVALRVPEEVNPEASKMAEFDFDLKYKPGRANQVADALSRKEPEVFVAALSVVQGGILDEIKLALKDDPEAVLLMKRIVAGKTRRFWTEDGIIYANGNKPYVPHAGGLRRKLLYEAHDAPHAGHPRQARTLALLSSSYH
ncbi:uncharacterized protein LOC144705415 [Wolffia australiana]